MSLVPAKRPGRGGGRDSDYEDCEDDGLCVGYAEEVDERRAELLRRLEFKVRLGGAVGDMVEHRLPADRC